MLKETLVALSVATVATGAFALPAAVANAAGTGVQIAACQPCAAKNPCNPCAAANPCNPCAAKNPCNPCAAKNPCNPCAANPCAAAANPCNPCNPCKPKSN